jgi:hypothetical protein
MAHVSLLLAPISAMSTLTLQTVATMGHVTYVQLLLASTAAMSTMPSVNRCYCWTHDTHTIAASAHSSDRHSDINGPLLLLDTCTARLLLASIAATDTLTSVDHCYCWTRGTHTVAVSADSSDGHSFVYIISL